MVPTERCSDLEKTLRHVLHRNVFEAADGELSRFVTVEISSLLSIAGFTAAHRACEGPFEEDVDVEVEVAFGMKGR